MAEDKNNAEQVKISELGLDEEFLKSKEISPDGTVSKDKIEELKKENEEFAAKRQAGGIIRTAPENGEKTAAEGISLPDGKAPAGEEVQLLSKEEMQVDNENDWVSRYETILKGYADANNQEWKREEKNEDGTAVEGLKGNIGEAKFHFTSEDKAVVNAEGINAIVALAKETGQDIAFNEGWSDEFKAKMLAACEAQGVTIQGRPDAEAEKTNEENASAKAAPVEEQTMALQHVPGQGVYTLSDVSARGYMKMALGSNELDEKIADLKQKGAVIGNPDQDSAKLALFEYAQAMKENKTEQMQDLGNVLKKYGVESVKRNPDRADGQIEITSKDYGSYTPEEKAKIEESIQKLQPQEKTAEGVEKKNANAAVRQAAVAQRGTSLGG
uniref:Large polyvalent protein-associated domain-containing protein n=1 Tax=uncultured Alphaproteobacteria bacterium TaxID=91750 RepID=A0A6G8F347_9PROT|nr:hypothetical protein PlAlph_5040 [uncultured Alphaproteobacteria bacterium]